MTIFYYKPETALKLGNNKISNIYFMFPGFPGGTSGKEPASQCRTHKRCGFDPWVGKTPWRRA